MGADDVIIKGTESQKAYTELAASVSKDLSLEMDKSGNVTYQYKNEPGPVSKDAQQLVNAIDDHSIKVNVLANNTKSTTNNGLLVGGAFMGNTVTTTSEGVSLEARQEINPSVLSQADNYYGTPGSLTLHETTEAYQGALLSQKSGTSVGPATQADAANPNSVYSLAHHAAAPQNMIIYQAPTYNRLGIQTGATFSIQQGTKPAQIIMTYP